MRWFLLWTALALVAGAVVVVVGLRLWRSLRALVREGAAVAQRLSLVAERMQEVPAAGHPASAAPRSMADDVRTSPRQRR